MRSARIYIDRLSLQNKIVRAIWYLTRLVVFRPTPSAGFHWWRAFLLRIFGAKIGKGCKIAPSCEVWAPWNLDIDDFVCLGVGVDCYNVDKIRIGSYSTVSQRAFLCTASHDVSTLARPLTTAPIKIGEHAWICAEAFVGPGVSIESGAVVGARAVINKDVDPWMIVAGNPARHLKRREIRERRGFLE